MSLYRRGSTWYYDFCLEGRRYRGSTKQSSRTRAAQYEAVLLARAREKHSLLPTRRIPFFEEFSARFLQWTRSSRLEPATVSYYAYGCDMMKKTKIWSMRMDQIRADDTDALGFPGSSANGNRALRTLRRMLGKAVDWGFISGAPRIRLLKEHGRKS